MLLRFPVRDLNAAKATFAALLGVQPHIDDPNYVGFRIGDVEVGLDPNGHAAGMTGPMSHWQTGDIEGTLKALVAAGATIAQAVTPVGAGMLSATVIDTENNSLGVFQSYSDESPAQERYTVPMNRELYECATKEAQPYGVVPLIHPYDYMFRFLAGEVPLQEAAKNYFSGGREWAERLQEIVYDRLGYSRDVETPLSLLEFAAGFGRVSRHLPSALPNARLAASDIHPQAVTFIRAALGIRSVRSALVPQEAHLGGDYDVIAAQSFFSHMPPHRFGAWLSVLASALRPGGYLFFTTRGADAMARSGPDLDGGSEIPERGWYFSEKSEQFDLDTAEYGAMFVSKAFVEEKLRACAAPMELVIFEPDGWYVQDLYVARRLP